MSWVHFAVRAFQICVGHDPWTAVARARDVDHVQIVRVDDAVQMGVDEVQPGRRAPVAEQARFDVRQGQPFPQQRIVVQIDLTHRQIVRRAPVGVHLVEQCRCQ